MELQDRFNNLECDISDMASIIGTAEEILESGHDLQPTRDKVIPLLKVVQHRLEELSQEVCNLSAERK